MNITEKAKERSILVGVATQETGLEKEMEYLEELAFLVKTAGAECIKTFVQNLEKADKKFYVGSGKLEEIRAYVEAEKIDTVIFDDELSPSQTRNVEDILKCKILDRTTLILAIFALHARTAHARTQVELAQYQYMLPRLTNMWTHLSKQKGGIGMRGPGEKEIETDRRIIHDKISLLKEKLKEIDQQKVTQRKNRERMVRVALVGYTNVGKSTIMNVLSKSDVLVENKLFATLDTTVRKVVIDNLPFLLSDTVGFIRKLPHHLVESFKSTLDEVKESDILLHVVDISHPEFEEQMQTVEHTLGEIGWFSNENEINKDIPRYKRDTKSDNIYNLSSAKAGLEKIIKDKTVMVVFNKIDNYTYEEKEEDDLTPITKKNYDLDTLKNMWIAKTNIPCFFISAKTKENINDFKEVLYEEIKKVHINRYPYDKFLYPLECE